MGLVFLFCASNLCVWLCCMRQLQQAQVRLSQQASSSYLCVSCCLVSASSAQILGGEHDFYVQLCHLLLCHA